MALKRDQHFRVVEKLEFGKKMKMVNWHAKTLAATLVE